MGNNITSLLKNKLINKTSIIMVLLITFAYSSLSISHLLQMSWDGVFQEYRSGYLASDLRISTDTPLPQEHLDFIDSLENTQVSKAIRFTTALINNPEIEEDEKFVLSGIKAVSSNYPLKGTLTISTQDSVINISNSSPHHLSPRSVWVSQQIIDNLGVSIGDTVSVGSLDVKIDGVIVKEPDYSFSWLPTVIMNIDELGQASIIQPGSRVYYHSLFVSDSSTIDSIEEYFQADPKARIRKAADLSNSQENRGSTFTILKQVENFLLIGKLLTFLLAGVAVIVWSRNHTMKEAKSIALFQIFGLNRSKLILLFISYNLIIYAISSIIGFTLAYILYTFILQVLPVEIEQAGLLEPFAYTYTSGLFLIIGFLIFPQVYLIRQPLMGILKQSESAFSSKASNISYYIFLFLMICFFAWFEDNWLVGITMIISIFALITIFSTIRKLLMYIFSPILSISKWISFRWAALTQKRHSLLMNFQTLVYSVILSIIALFLLLHQHLISQWGSQLPPNTPNYFFININTDSADNITNYWNDQSLDTSETIPYLIARGRIVRINGEDVDSESAGRSHGISTPLNTTSTKDIPRNNTIVNGAWFDDYDSDSLNLQSLNQNNNENLIPISMESSYLDDLGLSLGDRLTFDFTGIILETQITSIRSVQWQNLTPNFYVIFPENTFVNISHTYMYAINIPSEQRPEVNAFLRDFPGSSVFDIEVIISQAIELVDNVSLAMSSMLILIVVLSLLVIIMSIRSNLPKRMKEFALLRFQGASQQQIVSIIVVEYTLLAIISSIIAIVCSEIANVLIQTRVFDSEYVSYFSLWLGLPIFAILLIVSIGLGSSYKVLKSSPILFIQRSN